MLLWRAGRDNKDKGRTENEMEHRIARLIPQFEAKGLLIDEKELHIVKELGKGASGTVYKAEYRNETVAVKIYDQAMLTQDFVSCVNEMEIMCSMQHENIIPVKGLVLQKSPPKAGLVMALAKKGELGDALYKSRMIKRGGSELKFKIAIGMAEGLKYLHSHNVIHRDIKPANVLLGENGEALLTDFGYSRYIDTSGCMTGETGSYRYMAAEVIRSAKYTEKADVFSWAVVVNELFTGEKPYEYQMPLDVARSVVKQGLRPSQRKIKNLRLKGLLARAWDEQPTQRPSWDEIIAELELACQERKEKRAGVLGGMASRMGAKTR